MNNKGFTLIEIIAVVGLLALIGTMIGTNLVSMNQKQNQKNYENYKTTIANAGCLYYESKNAKFYSNANAAADRKETDLVSKQYCLTSNCYTSTGLLIENGYIPMDLIDPTTQKRVGNREIVVLTFDKNPNIKTDNGIKQCYYQ